MIFPVSSRFKTNLRRHRFLASAVGSVFLVLSAGYLVIPGHTVTGLTLLLVAAVAVFARGRGRRLETEVEAGIHNIEVSDDAIRFREGIVIPVHSIREVKIQAWFGRRPTLVRVRSGPPVPWRHRRTTIDLRNYDRPDELAHMLESVRPERAPGALGRD